jgi:hypothetical protein
VHDISDLELRGIPGVFVATEEFVSAGTAQSVALGMPSLPRGYPTHPEHPRPDEEMITMADQFFLEILACITSSD